MGNITDLAWNSLTLPASAQMLGYVEPTESLDPEKLNLKMYRFIRQSIRDEDLSNGNLFLKRFLQGPQNVWGQTQENIFKIKSLWNVLEIDDEFLIYLKSIVGWTSNLDPITDLLDLDTLRKLIAVSVAFWKNRGPEDSTIDILNLLTGSNLRIWNWFDFRWIIGETAFAQENEGYDSWMVNAPGLDTYDEYYSSLRIVDNGLDKDLVRNVVKLCRGVGERIEIIYLSFLDEFNVLDDNSQWETQGSYSLTVAGGSGFLEDDLTEEIAVINTEESEFWSKYLLTIKGKGKYWFGAFYFTDEDNYLRVLFSIPTNEVILQLIGGGVLITIDTLDYSAFGTLYEDVFSTLRVQIETTSGQNLIRIYVDNDKVIDLSGTSGLTQGKIGFGHLIGSTVEIGEVESFDLPASIDLIDINS